MASITEGVCKLLPHYSKSYRPSENYFGYSIYDAGTRFHFMNNTKCRETLHKSRETIASICLNKEKTNQEIRKFNYDSRPFWFYTTLVPKEFFALFFTKVEERLGINSGLSFQSTDEKGWIAIHPGPFWGGIQIRLGFFTCLLRGAAVHVWEKLKMNWDQNIENWIDWVLFCSEYLSQTPFATFKFISGKTFVQDIDMTADWHLAFYNSNLLVEKSLLDPRKFSHDEYLSHVGRYASRLRQYRPALSIEDSEYIADKYAALNAMR